MTSSSKQPSETTILNCSSLKVYGPPGTGKTTYLVDTLSKWLKELPLEQIAFVTFTRAARGEVEDRVRSNRKYKNYKNFDKLRTIHAMCYGQLPEVHVLGPKELLDFAKYAGCQLNTERVIDPLSEHEFTFVRAKSEYDKILQAYHLARHKCIPWFDVMPHQITLSKASSFIQLFREWKHDHGLSDFTDLLEMYINVGRPLDIKRMIVDEAQDLSPLQWRVVDKMAENAELLVIAGDDDQAIFNWAGASSDIFHGRLCDKDKVLEQSYRLTTTVQELSGRIISRVSTRKDKVFAPRAIGMPIELTFNLTEEMLSDPSTMVLARGRQQLMDIYERVKLFKVKPSQGMMTIHQAKGREANTVILCTEMPRASHEFLWEMSPEEEHRVWYVAVTRAKERLIIYKPDSWRHYEI